MCIDMFMVITVIFYVYTILIMQREWEEGRVVFTGNTRNYQYTTTHLARQIKVKRSEFNNEGVR